MAKISLREAIMDFVGIVLNEVYKRDYIKNHEIFRDIIYDAMYRLSLDYLDRVDDVATREMSLEIDRLNNLTDSLRDNLNRKGRGHDKS
jgi:hypothetical protein